MTSFLSSICRLCGNTSEELIKIYDENGFSPYTEIVHKYLNIDLEAGETSVVSICWCEDCRRIIDQWHEFANRAKFVDAVFTSLRESVDVVLDSDSAPQTDVKRLQENLRLANRKKKRRRKLKEECVDINSKPIGFEVLHTTSAIDSSGNNDKIRLTIRKVKEEESQAGSSDKTEDAEVKEELVSLADDVATLEDIQTPTCSPPHAKEENIVKNESRCQNDLSQIPWECWYCKSMQASWNALARHCKTNHDATPKIECLCGQILTCRSSIVKHHLKHTVGLKYKCDYNNCNKTFVRQTLLDAHALSHLPKDKQPWLCCKCCRRFHSEYLLKQHERLHLPNDQKVQFPCYLCSKKLCSKSAVSAHVRSVHLRERPFVCDQCGLSFTSKGILAEHLLIHSDEYNHHCQDCEKSFKTKYRLRIHMDTHLQTRYSCPICDLTLNTRRTLRMHLLVHQDRKRFSCDTCGKRFKRSKDLKNHRNLHTGNRPYFCSFCPRTFANGSNCRSHKRRMHPVELKQLEDGVLVSNDTTLVHLSDAIEEESLILQGDVLMTEPDLNTVDNSLDVDKEGDEGEGEEMAVFSSDDITASFAVHPFHTVFSCNSFLYR